MFTPCNTSIRYTSGMSLSSIAPPRGAKLAATEQPGFVFAHLSDPHLSSLKGVALGKLANKRLLGYLSWRHRRRNEHRREVLDALVADLHSFSPGHTVVTGDLTHVGLPREFGEVRRWLDGVGAPAQVTVVPGNHDRYIEEDWQQTFARWLPFMASDKPAGGCVSGPRQCLFPSLRVRDGLAFIGLSSARPSAPGLAVGSLGGRQLRLLEKILADTGRRGLFRVVLLHHPPAVGAVAWRKRLTDAARLRQVVREQGAELILHGHAHSDSRGSFDTPVGRVPVIGVASASMVSTGHGEHARYHLYRVRREPGGWRLHTRVRGCAQTGKGFGDEPGFDDFIASSS